MWAPSAMGHGAWGHDLWAMCHVSNTPQADATYIALRKWMRYISHFRMRRTSHLLQLRYFEWVIYRIVGRIAYKCVFQYAYTSHSRWTRCICKRGRSYINAKLLQLHIHRIVNMRRIMHVFLFCIYMHIWPSHLERITCLMSRISVFATRRICIIFLMA